MWSFTSTPGYLARNAATIAGSTYSPGVVLAPIRSDPCARPSRSASAWRAPSTADTARSANCSKTRPASVTATTRRRPRRKKSCLPSSPSSSLMCSESVGCDEWIFFAARLKLFSRATARKTSSCRKVISGFPYAQIPNFVLDPIAPPGVLQAQNQKGGRHDLPSLPVAEDRLRQLSVRLSGRSLLRCGGSTARHRALSRSHRSEIDEDHAHLRDSRPGRSRVRSPAARRRDRSASDLSQVGARGVPSPRRRRRGAPRARQRGALDPSHARTHTGQHVDPGHGQDAGPGALVRPDG